MPWSFSLEPAICPDCHRLVVIPTLTFPEKTESVQGLCPVCGGCPERIPLAEIPCTHCPVCGEMTLEMQDIGLWD